MIPVYNVEKYLRQCLDSVVNQTLRNIQIICVNDGSPDNSRAILQEYADRDSRIEIIDKPNGGLSSARNAAYPRIRGKYTLFIDSDDWIDIDTCEKTYQKTEATGAAMTLFFFQREGEKDSSPSKYQRITSHDKVTVNEKLPLLDIPSVCDKLWRTDFLLGNKLFFPEGLASEDILVNWQAVILADKISVVPERLYHYRCNPGSITQTSTSTGEHSMHLVPIYNKIYQYLLESGYYAAYRDKFISQKLRFLYAHYCLLRTYLKPRFAAMIRDSLSDDDREFYRSAPKKLLPELPRLFCKMIDGGSRETANYHVARIILPLVAMPEKLLRRWVVKPIKKRLKAA